MSSLSFRRTLAALVLGLVLLSPWASASEIRGRMAHRSSMVTQVVPVTLGSMWNGFLRWIMTRVTTGPNGACENGTWVDPNGRCSVPTVTMDAGCSPDPNGRCASGN